MDKFETDHEFSECTADGICSISPSLSSIHDVILIYLEELAFYLLELSMFGADNERIKEDIIDAFSGLIQNTEYTETSLNRIITNLYSELYQAKELYTELCKKHNQEANYLKSPIKTAKQFNITNVIKQGQKYYHKKEDVLTEQQKFESEIMLLILKSIFIYMVELKTLNQNMNEIYKDFLAGLSLLNFSNISLHKMDEIIKKYINITSNLMMKTYEAIKTEFGELVESEVPTEIIEGKAILASGSCLKDLENLLEATKDKGINIYTHGQLITAHAFEKFKKYSHLVGHYGRGFEFSSADFLSFSGVIFLTRLSLVKVGNMYFSKIYTMDKAPSQSITSINQNNFEPIINSALTTEGLSKKEGEDSSKRIKSGLSEEKLNGKLEELLKKIDADEIKNLFIIGPTSSSPKAKEYYDKFLHQLQKNDFAINFSQSEIVQNTLRINFEYATPIMCEIVHKLLAKKESKNFDLNIMINQCCLHTVPNLLSIKDLNVNNIYFGECSPWVINPSFLKKYKEELNIKEYSTPEADYKHMTSNN